MHKHTKKGQWQSF